MAPLADPNCQVEHYKRTEEQNSYLGLAGEEEEKAAEVRLVARWCVCV